MPDVTPLDPERLFKTLASHEVRHVLIAAMARQLQGFPRLTADRDNTPALDDENLARVSVALGSLGARIYTDRVPEQRRVAIATADLA